MVDWGRTMEFWEDCPEMKEKKKIVLRENLIAYFSWKINKYYLNNKEFYKFVPYDRYRRKLSSVLKKDIKEYRIIKI